MSKGITASERFISDHQLDAQEKIIDLEIIRLEMQMGAESTEEVWKFKDGLGRIKYGIKEMRRDLHLLPVKRKRLWDRLRIRVYSWSVRERFE